MPKAGKGIQICAWSRETPLPKPLALQKLEENFEERVDEHRSVVSYKTIIRWQLIKYGDFFSLQFPPEAGYVRILTLKFRSY